MSDSSATRSPKHPNPRLFDRKWYEAQTHFDFDNLEEALSHYRQVGSRLLIAPNRFISPKLMQRLYPDQDGDLLALDASRSISLGPLFDPRYCQSQNRFGSVEVERFAIASLWSDQWFDFHPLLTRRDFLASGSSSLMDWIEQLSDPDRSLLDQRFVHFTPKWYADTASQRRFDNELLDYLCFGMITNGQPHVFCDPWYAAQYSSRESPPRLRDLVWLDVCDRRPGSRAHSPLFDGDWFNEECPPGPDEADKTTTVERYLLQSTPALPPAPEIVPSALMRGLLQRPLEDCHPDQITVDDMLEVFETVLAGSTPAIRGPIRNTVCILNHNKATHTALAAICAARNAPPDTEILVLDNGSKARCLDVIVRLTRHYENIRVLKSPRNLFFGEGNNVLYDAARGDLIVFLNNDAYVGPTTLQTLADFMNEAPHAAGCGVTMLFPDLTIQEAGGHVSDCGQQLQLKKHADYADYHRQFSGSGAAETQYISSACFCVRREVLEQVGGYDYLYEPFYFEDTDLCKRITESGGKLFHIPHDYVIHVENATTREFLGDDFMKQIQRNREVFRSRWMYAPKGATPRRMSAIIGRAPVPTRPDVLIFTPHTISLGGGERYILSVAATLARVANVTIATHGYLSRSRLSFVMDDLGVALDDTMVINLATFDEAVEQPQPDLMITMGNEIIPPVPMIGRRNIYHVQFPFPVHRGRRWQVHRLERCESVWVNSEYTRTHTLEALHSLRIERPVHVTYAPVHPPEPTTHCDRLADPVLRITNVGRFDPDGHAKRQDLMLEVVQTLQVNDNAPPIRLDLVGGCGTGERVREYLDELRNQGHTNVHFHVNAPRETLVSVLAQADIYLHACGFGVDPSAAPEKQEHFGIAVLEAMGYGAIPIVYDGGGPAELVAAANVGFTFRSVAEAADHVRSVLAMDTAMRAEQARRAREFAAGFEDARFAERVLEFAGLGNADTESET